MTTITITKSGFIFKVKMEAKTTGQSVQIFLEGNKMPLAGTIFSEKANRFHINNWAESKIDEYLQPGESEFETLLKKAI